jgi:multimeric flavodoxin WrbA
MEWRSEQQHRTEIESAEGTFTLTLLKEDFSGVYPGMVRYTLTVTRGTDVVASFRTNTYEYSPTCPLDAETFAIQKAGAWEKALRTEPRKFILSHQLEPRRSPPPVTTDVVVIQGSPRADGNCGILAGWAVASAHESGKTAQVIFPHDMEIHACIGCYQCYNSGSCTFDDDMTGFLHALRHAALIIVCTPVYTNTVAGGLKLLIDRCQAYHAERMLAGGGPSPKGLLFSVAGRKGHSNFACVTGVVGPFMRNIGIVPSGEILIDDVDEHRDVRSIAGLEEKVRTAVRKCMIPSVSPPRGM